MADDEARLWIGNRHAALSLEQVVERCMFGVHFSPRHRIDDDGRRVGRSMGTFGGGRQPIVLFGRHQHKLAAAMPRDFYRLTLSLVLELAELALELQGRDFEP